MIQKALAAFLHDCAFRFGPLHMRPGPLCIHLGAALILLGNLWGTDSSFRLRQENLSGKGPSSGYMALRAGEVKTALTADDLLTVSGDLPFGLRLESFRVEYYGADNTGRRPVRSYISEVTILANGAEMARKTIRVNQPLYYGGYHIYQRSCDLEQQYTVLYAKSAQGLRLVYAGFILLAFGVIWWGWAQPMLRGLWN